MATSAYQQSDYKTNVDQTDRHLHVTSGDKTLKTEEQSLDNYSRNNTLDEILKQLVIMNKHLSIITDVDIKEV
jgi:hypothetical protein